MPHDYPLSHPHQPFSRRIKPYCSNVSDLIGFIGSISILRCPLGQFALDFRFLHCGISETGFRFRPALLILYVKDALDLHLSIYCVFFGFPGGQMDPH